MAMLPLLGSFWRRPPRRFALITLLIMGAAAWYVTTRGGWVNALHLPPVLDASTPRTQNGFTLEDIKTPGNDNGPWSDDRTDAAVLLIRPPAFPRLTTQYQTSEGVFVYGSSFGSRTPQLQASAQTSTGDVTPLNWKIIGTQTEPQFYRIEIPGGYSNECRYITVTLVPDSGPFPRWRITRLPNMRHAIPDAPQITDSVTKDGITTTARAWRNRHQIFLQVRPVLPPGSHQWEIATNDQWSEWEKFDRPRPNGATTRLPILGRGGIFSKQDTAYSGGLTTRFPAPYRSASRSVRVDCELRQFETHDERVTFHDVSVKEDQYDPRLSRDKAYYLVISHPLTVTTPSGISVTLPTQGQTRPDIVWEDALNFHMAVPPPSHFIRPIHSPLSLQFGKPVQITTLSLPTTTLYGQPDAKGGSWYPMSLPINPKWSWRLPREEMIHTSYHTELPPVLKDFTIIIRQRVDLQTIPMTFTVPVSDTPPPDIH